MCPMDDTSPLATFSKSTAKDQGSEIEDRRSKIENRRSAAEGRPLPGRRLRYASRAWRKVKYFAAKKLYTVVTQVASICDGVAHSPHPSTKNFRHT